MHANPIHELTKGLYIVSPPATNTHQHYILNGILFTSSAHSQPISQKKKNRRSTKFTSYYTDLHPQLHHHPTSPTTNSLSNPSKQAKISEQSLKLSRQIRLQYETCITENTVPAPAWSARNPPCLVPQIGSKLRNPNKTQPRQWRNQWAHQNNTETKSDLQNLKRGSSGEVPVKLLAWKGERLAL